MPEQRPLAQLISAAELLAQGDSSDLVVLDVRVRYEEELAVADVDSYRQGHIPGAVFADVVGRLSGPARGGSQFQLPSPERFAAAAGALGIGAGTRVVLYCSGWPIWATRVWWLLRYHGFDQVALLDGGWQRWVAAGNPVQAGEVVPVPRQFVAHVRAELMASLPEVEAVVAGARRECLVNALPYAMFTGEVATHGSVHGRIPGSVSLPWPETADLESGFYRDTEAIIRAASRLPPDEPIVAYCGGGVSATALIFGLSLIGREDVKLYEGSMDEWASDRSRPLERDVEEPSRSGI